jgi:hypothetical protein
MHTNRVAIMMYALQLYVTQRLVHQACYRLVELMFGAPHSLC